ncbi:MAG: sigma-70 family RNA polymerase sigma factor, partial [Bacteroidota bacterium]
MNANTSNTDAQLIEQAKAGDQAAFKLLVDRYQGKVAGVVIGMMGRGMEAEDVGQETFIRFYRALSDFRGESAVGTYLTRIAINLSLNALQKRKRRFGEVDLETAAPELRGMGGTEAQERREAKELVHKALSRLKPEFRSVIVLRLLEGYSSKEAAEILEIPLGTVLSRLK